MQVAGGDCFVSLFCGSCAVESKVQGFSRKLLNDRHEYLIAMLQGVQQGYNLPEHITLEQYRYIRENKDCLFSLLFLKLVFVLLFQVQLS